jgi:hypothetical protein
MKLRPLRRRARVCVKPFEVWDRVFDPSVGWRRVVRTFREGDVVPANHPIVNRHRRYFRRGPA